MTKQNDITSTEKLLESIRQEQTNQKSEPSTVTGEGEEPLSLDHPLPSPPPVESSRISSNDIPPVIPPVKARTARTGKPAKSRRRVFPLSRKKADTVGIELKADGIGLVRRQSSGKIGGNTAGCFVPYGTETFKNEETLLADILAAEWFAPFLQKQLQLFCGKAKNVSIWCALPRESVQVHNVTIPKVPENEVANTVFWRMQKEESFDRGETILDFDLVKEVQEKDTTKILAIVYLASRQEVENLEALFLEIGYPLTGVSTPTVALQNEIRTGYFTGEDESFSRLVLGENMSFIELYFDNSLVFSRDVKTGISSFVDSLMEKSAALGIIMDENQCRKLILAEDHKVAGLAEKCGLFSNGETDIFSLELPAAFRLIRQMERTFDYYKNNFQIPRSRAIYLSGVSFTNTRLAAYLTTEIGIPCRVHAPFAELSRPANMNPTKTECVAYTLVPAFDMALSDRVATKNFLVPQALKEKQQQEAKVNKIALLATTVLLLACGGFFFWQHTQIQGKQASLQAITAEIGRGSIVDESQANTLLMAELGRLKKNSLSVTTLAERYLPLAFLGRMSSSLPPEIKLLRCALDEKKVKASKTEKESNIHNVSLQGVVTGSRHNMEFILTKYLRKLTETSFIVSAVVAEKDLATYQDEEVLTFTAQIGVAGTEKKVQEKPKA